MTNNMGSETRLFVSGPECLGPGMAMCWCKGWYVFLVSLYFAGGDPYYEGTFCHRLALGDCLFFLRCFGL